jgi:hypothetical protein
MPVPAIRRSGPARSVAPARHCQPEEGSLGLKARPPGKAIAPVSLSYPHPPTKPDSPSRSNLKESELQLRLYYASNQFTIPCAAMWYYSFRAQHLSLLRLRVNIFIR